MSKYINDNLNLSFDNFNEDQPDSQPSQGQYTLSKYYKKLRKGILLDEILEKADADEELFLVERINLLKAYQESLSQRKLAEVLTSMRKNVPLTQIISKTSTPDLVRIMNHINTLHIIEEHKLIATSKVREIDTSMMIKKKIESCKSLASRSFVFEEKQNFGETTPKMKEDKNLELDTSASSSMHFFDAWRKTPTPRQTKVPINFREGSEYNDPDDKQVVNFGSTLFGTTFKEILDNNEKYYAWFRWLKYKHLKVTSNQDCAIKAYNYFGKYLSYWDKI